MAATSSCSRNEVELGVGVGVGDGGEEIGVDLAPYMSENKIERVPAYLRGGSNSNEDYDPKVVSIGPYHHGKPELQVLEGFKHKVLEKFISGGRWDVNFYRNKLKVVEVVDAARRCYAAANGSTDKFSDSEFAEMMLLDACFLLYFILASVKQQNDDDDDDDDDDDEFFWCSTTHQLLKLIGESGYFFICLDMCLFENQIPLWIVEFLFNVRFGSTLGISWKQLLVEFCHRQNYGDGKCRVLDEEYRDDDEQPLHLLEAFHMNMVLLKSHTTLLVSPSTHSAPTGRCCPTFMPTLKNSTIQMSQQQQQKHQEFEEYGYIFRSVMDLKAKGVHFGRSDNIYSVMSITFESNHVYAKIKLPIWYATPLSRVFFTNMIAYEVCPNHRTRLEISSYITFMKSLIVCPNDVKELREKRIISNILGDDMQVVQLFKGLNPHGFDNPDIFSYVKQKIQEHYDSKANTWMAELINTYLRSPWTIITLLAASILLLLTFAQTYAAFKWRN